MIINRIYETQNLLSLYLVSFLVGLRTYQHPLYTSLSSRLRLPFTPQEWQSSELQMCRTHVLQRLPFYVTHS